MDRLGVRGCLREIVPLSREIRTNAIKLYPWLRWMPLPIGTGAVLLGVAVSLVVRLKLIK